MANYILLDAWYCAVFSRRLMIRQLGLDLVLDRLTAVYFLVSVTGPPKRHGTLQGLVKICHHNVGRGGDCHNWLCIWCHAAAWCELEELSLSVRNSPTSESLGVIAGQCSERTEKSPVHSARTCRGIPASPLPYQTHRKTCKSCNTKYTNRTKTSTGRLGFNGRQSR